MKVIRGQEASLESSKGFSRDIRSTLKAVSTHAPKSMKIYWNIWKSMQIHRNLWKSYKIWEIRWKSSDEKKPAWNRAEVCKASPSKIPAYRHAKFESLIPRATIASAKRSDISSSKHRGLERPAAEAVACKLSNCHFMFLIDIDPIFRIFEHIKRIFEIVRSPPCPFFTNPILECLIFPTKRVRDILRLFRIVWWAQKWKWLVLGIIATSENPKIMHTKDFQVFPYWNRQVLIHNETT